MWGFRRPGQRARVWASWQADLSPLHLPWERRPRKTCIATWPLFLFLLFLIMENKTVLEKDITSCRRSKQRSDLSLHMPSPGTHPQCPAQGGRCSHSLHSLPLPPASYEAIMPDHRWCGMCVSFTAFFCLVHHIFLKDFTHLNKYHFSTLWLDFWFYYRYFF